jgi:hypothetical protein
MSDHLPHHLCCAVPWLPREKMIRLSIKLPQLTTGIAKSPKDVIAGDQSKRTFIERTWWGCSSLLEAYLPAVERFGLESYFIELGRKPVTTTTLASA